VRIAFDAANWVIRSSDAPNGFYLVFDDGREPVLLDDVQVGPFESPEQTNRHRDDRMAVMTPELRFEANRSVRKLDPGEFSPIIPSPSQIELTSDSIRWRSPVQVHAEEALNPEYQRLVEGFALNYGIASSRVDDPADADVLLNFSRDMSASECRLDGGYELNVRKTGSAVITARDRSGVFYGIQSLIGLADPALVRSGVDTIVLPVGRIQDCPRFAYRGLMVDVARHFQPSRMLEKTIDRMSFYKLNRLHLHLSDDEGWRIPVGSLPELTAIGGRRGHTLDSRDHLPPSFGSGPDPESSPGSGSLSRDDLVGLIRFAADRHVEIIPEIDVPGHARAAIMSMEHRYRRLAAEGDTAGAVMYRLIDPGDTSEYLSIQGWNDNVVNVCIESTYRFLEVVVVELRAMYEEAGVPLRTVHVGGDEVPAGVWEGSPACMALLESGAGPHDVTDLPGYFFNRIARILARAGGLNVAGWDEIAEVLGPASGPSARVIPYAWNTVWGWGGEEKPYRLANEGYHVVMSGAQSLYFDLAYEKHPAEPGYAWAGFVDDRAVFAFEPLNVYLGASHDRMGHPIPPDQYADAVRLTSEGAGNILGIQGQLWGERTPDSTAFEYQLYPKMLALAERAWSPQPDWTAVTEEAPRQKASSAAWNRFANTLGQREFVRLRRVARPVNFRIPPPGLEVADSRLHVNTAYPGLEVRYTVDGSDPDPESELYRGPVEISRSVRFRAFDVSGRGGRTESLE
ncbi:MAG TPA: family 20 glycosylhydrolase, partial [Rhodothermia bacterium]|nr:family 20 glycosylhydrolase [Rhodothermia bacterium]